MSLLETAGAVCEREYQTWVSSFLIQSPKINENQGYHIDLFIENQPQSSLLKHSICAMFCNTFFFAHFRKKKRKKKFQPKITQKQNKKKTMQQLRKSMSKLYGIRLYT